MNKSIKIKYLVSLHNPESSSFETHLTNNFEPQIWGAHLIKTTIVSPVLTQLKT